MGTYHERASELSESPDLDHWQLMTATTAVKMLPARWFADHLVREDWALLSVGDRKLRDGWTFTPGRPGGAERGVCVVCGDGRPVRSKNPDGHFEHPRHEYNEET